MDITLDIIEINDADKIARWKSDPELANLLMSNFSMISLNEAKEWIVKNTNDKNQRLNGVYKYDNLSKTLIGITRLMFIDFESGVAEFGTYIGDIENQGKGYGKLALEMTINQAFEELDLRKIFLRVNATNTGAFNLYKKMNFEIEGVLKKHFLNNKNEFEDIIYMSIFKVEEK